MLTPPLRSRFTSVICRSGGGEIKRWSSFGLFHFSILVIIIFSKIAIFETCHKSIWNFNEVFNSYFEVELGLYEIHLKLRSNGNENHLIVDFIFESPF